MTRIAIPAVAYEAMGRELSDARAKLKEQFRRVRRLSRLYEQFAPEEDAQEVAGTFPVDTRHPVAGSGGAQEPAPTSSPTENKATAVGQVAGGGATEIPRAGPPSPRTTDATLPDLPECLDVRMRTP